jgi:hypothetical protein
MTRGHRPQRKRVGVGSNPVVDEQLQAIADRLEDELLAVK